MQSPRPFSLKSYRAERGQLCSSILGLDLFADLKCVVRLDIEVANGAFDGQNTNEQKWDRAKSLLRR